MTPEQLAKRIVKTIDESAVKALTVVLADPRQTASHWKKIAEIHAATLVEILLVIDESGDSADNQTD